MVGIVGYGVYLPRLRLSRAAIFASHGWFNPGLKALAKGERALAYWDEDAITLGVEAGRAALAGHDRAALDGIAFASVSAPFQERQNSGVIAKALSLPRRLASLDLGGSTRAGSSALLRLLQGDGEQLLIAADQRKARPGSTQELLYGDGATAFVLGKDKPLATLLGAASFSEDFIDHYRGQGEDFDYGWEERWIRDEGYGRLIPEAAVAALQEAGVKAEAITHFILPCAFPGLNATLAKKLGIAADAVIDTLHAECGDTGSAHALLLLAGALESAKPGDTILLCCFGNGADALVLRVEQANAAYKPVRGLKAALSRKRTENNYAKLLAFNDLLPRETGIRSEGDRQTALTVLHRKADMLTSLIGGKCRICGTAQFPKTRICVNPNCDAIDSQDEHPFAETPAGVLSWSADWLTYTPEPPQHYGMVTFAEGGRLMTDFTDVDPGGVEVGMAMRMVFRIKDIDRQRGFRRYFWKAAPA